MCNTLELSGLFVCMRGLISCSVPGGIGGGGGVGWSYRKIAGWWFARDEG